MKHPTVPYLSSRGYLLLELVLAVMILSVVGAAISRSFSQEIHLVQVAQQYQEADRQARWLMDDLQLDLLQAANANELQALGKKGGELPGKAGWRWETSLSPEGNFQNLYLIEIIISGLAGDRKYNLPRLIRVEPTLGDSEELLEEPL